MAYSAADLVAIDAAIASGAMKVRYPDGSEITYRTLDEMERVRARILADVAPATIAPPNRAVLVTF